LWICRYLLPIGKRYHISIYFYKHDAILIITFLSLEKVQCKLRHVYYVPTSIGPVKTNECALHKYVHFKILYIGTQVLNPSILYTIKINM